MRDYDPTLGRYLQTDPLGLVDGASVYGYALQNPGRYTDPRGEFVWFAPIIGFIGGAGINFAIQTGTNWYYGMPIRDSYRCVDLSKVIVAGAAGGGGVGVVGLVKARRFVEALGVGVVGFQANALAPTIPAAEPECGCDIPKQPWLVDFIRNLPL